MGGGWGTGAHGSASRNSQSFEENLALASIRLGSWMSGSVWHLCPRQNKQRRVLVCDQQESCSLTAALCHRGRQLDAGLRILKQNILSLVCLCLSSRVVCSRVCVFVSVCLCTRFCVCVCVCVSQTQCLFSLQSALISFPGFTVPAAAVSLIN